MSEVEGRIDQVGDTAERAGRDGFLNALHRCGRFTALRSGDLSDFLANLRIAGTLAGALTGILAAGLPIAKEHLDQRLQIRNGHIGESVLGGGVLLMALLMTTGRVTSGVAVTATRAAFHIASTSTAGGILILLGFAAVLGGLRGLTTLRFHRDTMGGLRDLRS